ncbi:hypothetical protein E1A91_D13G029300v1 [Gossypium mustelinum]|uniref:Uncharacterized protein n=1 Tax=Gossypium mustelinum TaxID=34275 RepID=A0A5D2RY62_GOSMU|nr:hypothetical protein E1A91_D13G029300v1 [Gossypium mustelinum]
MPKGTVFRWRRYPRKLSTLENEAAFRWCLSVAVGGGAAAAC